MHTYTGQERFLLATDCIIFGFDGANIKLLLVHRNMEPMKDRWSLMGGFIQQPETPDDAANRILEQLTGLKNVYMEQLHVFGGIHRDPGERTLSIAYFALIDIHQYEKQITHEHHAEWFLLNELPDLIFDHTDMVKMAKKQLRYKAALHPILFQLLPFKIADKNLGPGRAIAMMRCKINSYTTQGYPHVKWKIRRRVFKFNTKAEPVYVKFN